MLLALYAVAGSLEAFPTDERDEAVRLVAGAGALLALLFAALAWRALRRR